jgi:hypothetical protein
VLISTRVVRSPLLWRLVVASGHGVAVAVILLGMSGIVQASAPLAIATLNLPPPDHNAFSTSFRYDSQGILFAWDGFHVSQQKGMNVNEFSQLGTVIGGSHEPSDWPGSTSGDYNCADAGPINFSRDGQSILLGNGNGGYAPYGGPWFSGTVELQHSGRIWSMPIAGGTVSYPAGTQPISVINYHTDLIPLPSATTIPGSDKKYFVNQGVDYGGTGSEISIFDVTSGLNVPMIENGPGATTSLAFNPKDNRLYAGVGFGPGDRGKIYSFGLGQIDQAFHDGKPLDFMTDGILFNPTAIDNQSGAGMFFDANGYLFAGGNEGITCFKPDGTVSKILGSNNQYTVLVYNPHDDQILAVVGTTGTVYNASDFESVPEPSTVILLVAAGLTALTWRRWRRKA